MFIYVSLIKKTFFFYNSSANMAEKSLQMSMLQLPRIYTGYQAMGCDIEQIAIFYVTINWDI